VRPATRTPRSASRDEDPAKCAPVRGPKTLLTVTPSQATPRARDLGTRTKTRTPGRSRTGAQIVPASRRAGAKDVRRRAPSRADSDALLAARQRPARLWRRWQLWQLGPRVGARWGVPWRVFSPSFAQRSSRAGQCPSLRAPRSVRGGPPSWPRPGYGRGEFISRPASGNDASAHRRPPCRTSAPPPTAHSAPTPNGETPGRHPRWARAATSPDRERSSGTASTDARIPVWGTGRWLAGCSRP
jgi:hypothetical protein